MTEKEEKEKIKEQFEKFQKEEVKGEINFVEVYNIINKIIRQYCDLREDYYNILTLWVIGTWFHNEFPSFPFLFFNAMKGSGKSRLLKLLAAMSKNGEVLASLSEAVLFRTAQFSSIFIDEFEGIGKKNSNTLRELLNAAYKKGTKVKRAYKIKSGEREGQAIEEFNVYCPIAMCNIYGMESVLSDRCISLILEKSDKNYITKLIENFDTDPEIQEVKQKLSKKSVVCVVSEQKEHIYRDWNNYILYKNNNYINNTTTNTTETTQTTLELNINKEELELFNKIDATDINSRHLELFLPLFVLANNISPSILDETIETAKEIVKEKNSDDMIENRDVSFLDFLSHFDGGIDFIPIANLVVEFRKYIGEDDEETGRSWVTTKWTGWALKRLNLIIDKRRTGKGREVIVDFGKVKEKRWIFKAKK
jgi:hypothetical protein